MLPFLLQPLVFLAAKAHSADPNRAADSTKAAMASILQLPVLAIKPNVSSTAAGLAKRLIISAEVAGKLYSIQLFPRYITTIQIGTPPQSVVFEPDTGSPVTWTLEPNPRDNNSQSPSFSFHNSHSSTFEWLQGSGKIAYGFTDPLHPHNTPIGLKNCRDVQAMGGKDLGLMPFGLVKPTCGASLDNQVGILGLSMSKNKTEGFIDRLVSKQVISSRVFSLNTKSDVKHMEHGTLTFGGIDTSKFSGRLKKLAVLESRAGRRRTKYVIRLDEMSLRMGKGQRHTIFDRTSDPNGKKVLLDSGTPCIFVKEELLRATVEAMGYAFPAEAYKSGEPLPVDCNTRPLNGSLEFTFGNKTIRIPYQDLFLESGTTCYLKVAGNAQIGSSGVAIPFYSNAYIVHDMDNLEVHLAASADCGSNPRAVGKGPRAVGSVVGDCRGAPEPEERPEPEKRPNKGTRRRAWDT